MADNTVRMMLENEAAMLALGARLAGAMSGGFILYLQGSLGAGKTTLTRGILRGLGFLGKVKSPTYTLVEPYQCGTSPVYHFDLYRLQSADELWEMGFSDYFSKETICLVEWPEKGFPHLPVPDLICDIALCEVGREIVFAAQTERGNRILTILC